MTESAPKLKRAYWVVVLVLFLGIISAAAFMVPRSRPGYCPIAIPVQESGRVSFADTYNPTRCLAVERVDTPASRAQGLSGRKFLQNHQAMLFVFEESGRKCMWMKDMKFSIDMVWVDAGKKITHIERNVKPETYPNSFCGEGQYVIELNAGVADMAKLKTGQQLNL